MGVHHKIIYLVGMPPPRPGIHDASSSVSAVLTLNLNLSPSIIDAAIHAVVAASSSLHVSNIDTEPHIISAPSIKEGSPGPEPLLHWHADRPATNQGDDGNTNVDIPSHPFVTDIWDLTINFTDFVRREAIENAEALQYVQYPTNGNDNAASISPAEKALHWNNMALTGLHVGDGRYLTFSRIWFTKKATPIGGKAGNLNYSYIHVVERDEKMRAIPGTSRIVNIPFGPAADEEDCCQGPEDARAFVGPCGSPLLVFNMDVPDLSTKGQLAIETKIRAMHLYNHSSGDIVQLQIEGGVKSTFEKNWTPFIHNGTIHFAYSLAPLQILRLGNPSDGICKFVYVESEEKPQICEWGRSSSSWEMTQGLFFRLLESSATRL